MSIASLLENMGSSALHVPIYVPVSSNEEVLRDKHFHLMQCKYFGKVYIFLVLLRLSDAIYGISFLSFFHSPHFSIILILSTAIRIY